MERRHVSEARVTLARSIVGAALGARAVVCNAGPAPGAPTRTRLLRSPTNRPARVAQSSAQRVDEAEAGRAPRGPRFARFAAAMAAAPASQEQLFTRSRRRISTAGPVNTNSPIQWLGIGGWALFCAALFVSLLLRPDRAGPARSDPGTGPRRDYRPLATSMRERREGNWWVPRRGGGLGGGRAVQDGCEDCKTREHPQELRLITGEPDWPAAFSNVCFARATPSELVDMTGSDSKSGDSQQKSV